jgi:hypothetical protein
LDVTSDPEGGAEFLALLRRLLASGKGGGSKGGHRNIGWMNQLIQVPLWFLAHVGGALPADVGAAESSSGGRPASGGMPADGGAADGQQQVPGWLAEAMADATFMELALGLWIQYGKFKRHRPDAEIGMILQGFDKDKDKDTDKDKDEDKDGGGKEKTDLGLVDNRDFSNSSRLFVEGGS